MVTKICLEVNILISRSFLLSQLHSQSFPVLPAVQEIQKSVPGYQEEHKLLAFQLFSRYRDPVITDLTAVNNVYLVAQLHRPHLLSSHAAVSVCLSERGESHVVIISYILLSFWYLILKVNV